jgi:hypothetical protein
MRWLLIEGLGKTHVQRVVKTSVAHAQTDNRMCDHVRVVIPMLRQACVLFDAWAVRVQVAHWMANQHITIPAT